MNVTRCRTLVTVGAAFTLLLEAGAWVAAAQPRVDLSGTWILNADESDDTQEEFRRWVQSRSGAAGAGVTPGTGAGDAPASAGAERGGANVPGAGGGLLGMMESFSQGAERLTIVHSDPEVTITNAAGQANRVFTDGRLVERVDDQGGKTKVKTRWKKDKMIIDVAFPAQSNPQGGLLTPGITMTYSLDKSGRLELESTVALGAGVAPFTVKRIYDRAPPAG
jgi:hypothetical protein